MPLPLASSQSYCEFINPVVLSFPEDATCTDLPWSLPLTIFCPLPLRSLSIGVRVYDVLFVAEYSTYSYSQHFHTLWISMLMISHYTNKIIKIIKTSDEVWEIVCLFTNELLKLYIVPRAQYVPTDICKVEKNRIISNYVQQHLKWPSTSSYRMWRFSHPVT